MSNFALHQPVLLNESLMALSVKPEGIYVDATFGRGGHSREILKQLNHQGHLYCFDQDLEAINYGNQHFKASNMTLIHSSFGHLATVLEDKQLTGRVNGIFMDLGVSSPQLDDAHRGFSFQKAGPLDMRMNATCGQTAAQWLNQVEEDKLAYIIKEYGEERYARKIAKKIIETRIERAIDDTQILSELICSVIKKREPGKHPATRTFQAIRIYINQELNVLETALNQALECLSPKGRLAVISFHSLEDRIVKRFMRDKCQGNVPLGLPVRDNEIIREVKWVVKKQTPHKDEIEANPRSRSAILRVIEKNECNG